MVSCNTHFIECNVLLLNLHSKSRFSVKNTQQLPGWRSWLMSAVIIGTLEIILGHFTGFWSNLKNPI